MIFGRKKSGPPVTVTASVQGMLGHDYLDVATDIEVPAGCTVAGLVDALKKRGEIDSRAYGALKGVRPPLTLLVNGDSLSGNKRGKTVLSDGDKVTILTPVAGG